MRRSFKFVSVAAGALAGIGLAGWALVPSWQVAATEVSPASPAQIWQWYADSDRTPNWDYLVEVRTVNGPFASGTEGANKAVGGPAFRWVYTAVRTDHGYTEVTSLPLAKLTATHELTEVPGGTQIAHVLRVAGPLAWLYYLVLHAQFEQGIHAAMHRLAAGAAMGPPPASRPAS